ncbi:MAG: aconitate hydratase AcnA [Pseudomonadota bacterium]|nr:aconitate hydratase AcnA [Pseudomonadota bacterium]
MSQGRTFQVGDNHYNIVDISSVESWKQLPYCIRILYENVLRNAPQQAQKWHQSFDHWLAGTSAEISFYPARVLMQDLTGVPALVDLTAMRDAVEKLGGNPQQINPRCDVDLVIDHSVTVDYAMDAKAFEQNVAVEVQKNKERYELLKWAQNAYENMNIVPPGKGICHQVNLERLGKVVIQKNDSLYLDTLVGLDSHTTMINGLGVLGWGVGGIEAEAAMLGQPISLNLPKVIGVELLGTLSPGITATDLVLHMTEYLRSHGVVGQFVEFFGVGAQKLSLAERATIANMAPEFGATCAFFPVDEETLSYMALTGRDQSHIDLTRAYLTEMDLMWADDVVPQYSQKLSFDLAKVEACIAGPKRPEQKVPLSQVKASLGDINGDSKQLSDGSIVIAAITSCTNTSNPSVLIGAGLLAKNAYDRGLRMPDWVKASFAPGSRVVVDYLKKLQLMESLESLGFYLVGFGCTTCIGNSGPLHPQISKAIKDQNLKVGAVLSGNRNFEGRVHPETQLNYLASPPLVIAYALAGHLGIDFKTEPLGYDGNDPVFLEDIWPSDQEIQHAMGAISADMFKKEYEDIFSGTADWEQIVIDRRDQFSWDPASTYIRQPNFFENMSTSPEALKDIKRARVLAILGDSVTTDHISPAGAISPDSEAAKYLAEKGISEAGYHSYGARRGNAEIMVRGTFANIRLTNAMSSKKGGYTTHYPSGQETSIFQASQRYQAAEEPAVIFAGQFYGTGSSRDWAAKGTKLLGVKAVIAESFERIHRSNLIGMGVLPCVLLGKLSDLSLIGDELITIEGVEALKEPGQLVSLKIEKPSESSGTTTLKTVQLKVAIETENELQYFQHGGILSYVLRGFMDV